MCGKVLPAALSPQKCEMNHLQHVMVLLNGFVKHVQRCTVYWGCGKGFCQLIRIVSSNTFEVDPLDHRSRFGQPVIIFNACHVSTWLLFRKLLEHRQIKSAVHCELVC